MMNIATATRCHNSSPVLRAAVTAPIARAGIERAGGIADDMVVARRRIGADKECVALFDYYFGQSPDRIIESSWDNVQERRVTLRLEYPAQNARSLRGKIVQRRGNTIEVVFKGVDMILVDRR
jgi:hypothetical protein